MTETLPTPMLRSTDLADRWSTSTQRLANLRHQGRGPAYVKIGSAIRYHLRDVEAYEQRHRVATLEAA